VPVRNSTVRRRYDSPLRAEASARTRGAILAAFAAQLARPGATEVSVPDAARDAGVSVRTVYHHFPDDASRRSALAAWIEQQLSGSAPFPTPQSPDDLGPLTRRLYRGGAARLDLVRAQATNGFAHPVRLERLAGRRRAIAAVVRSIGAPPTPTRRATAMIQHLMSAEAALPLIDVHGLSPAGAADIAADTVDALLGQLRSLAAQRPPRR
jgi:AcrR family transcriptional regulator